MIGMMGMVVGSGLKGWISEKQTDGSRCDSEDRLEELPEMECPICSVAARTGEIILEDPESPQADLWHRFRQWCVSIYQDSDDMLQKLMASGKLVGHEDRLQCDDFCERVKELGWTSGNELMLFHIQCPEENGLSSKNFRWLDLEKKRQLRKERARQKAQAEAKARRDNQKATKMVLEKFKRTLKATYGSYLRAWRLALSPSDTMVLTKAQFFLACSEMGWSQDVRRLWKAFGKDHKSREDQPCISIDDLDPHTAEILAHFRAWIAENFGSATEAFRELDRSNKKSVRLPEFLRVLGELDFDRPAKVLFHGLDKDGTKTLVQEDLLFLDKWKPPSFLMATPNQNAVDLFKSLLVSKFRSYLKAWRRILDTDNSNRCDWQEFQVACTKHLNFMGDMAGAWRALDKGLSGYITLAQLDLPAAECLLSFRDWATREFGSVKSAFSVLDSNASMQISREEFNRGCRIYGYDGEGSSGSLFRALDVERSNYLSIDEVAFLDEWESTDLREIQAALGKPPRKSHFSSRVSYAEKMHGIKFDAGDAASKSARSPSKERDVVQASLRQRRYTRMPTPERAWWNNMPHLIPPKAAKPSSGKGRAVFGPMWCTVCKSRGFCSHAKEHVELRASTAPGCTRRALMSGLSAPRSPRAVSSMSSHLPPATWDAQTGRMQTSCDLSHEASIDDSTYRYMGSVDVGCSPPDAEVQYTALRRFPIGSVTPDQATAALRMLATHTEFL